ncbi:MAG: phospholipase D family protein [Dehalococcoidales bacterium]|nr:phospholipase D family protein [Dehalococcoidales bacterium]
MAQFLDTTGVSFYLSQLINNSNEKLILISPYLKIGDRLKQSIEDKDRMKIDIRLIYGKNELELAEHNWLKTLKTIRTSFCQNLHAKCYLNEKEAIITSMNLYDYSQTNNNEMGIYINKENDSDLYDNIYKEAMRLVRISDEYKVSVTQVPKIERNEKIAKAHSTGSGFCIRCNDNIELKPKSPYCSKCFSSWKKFGNNDYEEKYCHICGESNKSTIMKPTCYNCYKSNKDKLDFPLQK